MRAVGRGFKSRPGLHISGSESLDEPSRPPFKVSSHLSNGMTEIHNYSRRLERFRRNISRHKYGSVALRFLDHLGALGLSKGRITKYAEHLPPLLKILDVDPCVAAREDVERVVAWINGQPWKEWTKHDYKLALRKFIQYAKYGSCSRETPIPEEVSWISLKVKEKDSRVKPEDLLSREEFEAIVKATDNPRDRALVYVLFEAALRPGELLGMTVSSVEFKDKYCLIAVTLLSRRSSDGWRSICTGMIRTHLYGARYPPIIKVID